MLALINEIPDAVEPGLLHLCEFIEDCEFTFLSTQILHVLGKKGPKTSLPGRYIRHIYNRIILENATVRSAAVTSLSKFGAQVPSLRENIIMLLRRCVHDADDEVRDRATFYATLLSGESEPLIKKFIVDVAPQKLDGVVKQLEEYAEAGDFSVPFNFAKAVVMPIPQSVAKASSSKAGSAAGSAAAAAESPSKKKRELNHVCGLAERHSRVHGTWPALQLVAACTLDRERGRVCGRGHQAHVSGPYCVPIHGEKYHGRGTAGKCGD